MNYEWPTERLAALADEYVLGTLPRRARRRFESAMAASATLQAAVWRAEDRLLPLERGRAPVQPAPDTWRRIEAQLGLASPAAVPRVRSPRWTLALAAAIVGLALGIGWFVYRATPPSTFEVASLRAVGGPALWSIAMDRGTTRLVASASDAVRSQAGHDFELWALPEGGAPVSLGVLPASGHRERLLDPAQREALQRSTKVAVSLEPTGGSPTGAPTGPVLYVASLRRAIS